MMAVEGPFIAAVIARLAEPKFNLAAYGVAFSFGLMIEAPIIMIMSASVALVRDRLSYLKLRNFLFALKILITIAMLGLIFTPLFEEIMYGLIGLPPEVAQLTYITLILLIPWPAAIGYRRFYQGILIRNNQTQRVAYGTVIRLISMALTALGLYFFTDTAGAYLGAAAMSTGVTLEAIFTRIMAWSSVRTVAYTAPNPATEPLTYRGIIQFYYPLALSSMLSLGVRPLVTFFVGQSRSALESLAVLPVINSTTFIFVSVGLAFQEVAITFLGDKNEGFPALRRFALRLGLITVSLLALIGYTPLSSIWFQRIGGLTPELTEFARIPIRIVCILPGLAILLAFQRAILVNAKRTGGITIATAAEVVGMMSILFVMISGINAIGAIAATTAFVSGRIIANAYLFTRTSSCLRGE